MLKKTLPISAMVCAALMFGACSSGSNNGNNDDNATEQTTQTDESATAPEEDATADENPAANLEISNEISLTGNDQQQYNKTAFKVPVGQTITLTMKNIGSMPANTMSHDVVVLKPGSSISDYGNAAAQVKDHDKLPADKSDEVIAHTKMLGPGQSDKITFKVDEAGEYPFLCSFPGHYGTMNGIIYAVKPNADATASK